MPLSQTRAAHVGGRDGRLAVQTPRPQSLLLLLRRRFLETGGRSRNHRTGRRSAGGGTGEWRFWGGSSIVLSLSPPRSREDRALWRVFPCATRPGVIYVARDVSGGRAGVCEEGRKRGQLRGGCERKRPLIGGPCFSLLPLPCFCLSLSVRRPCGKR